MEKKPILIVLEGQDQIGKDTLLDMLKDDDKFIIYETPTYEEQGVDKKDKEAYKRFLMSFIRKQLDDIYSLIRNDKEKIVVISRLWISDNVFSDLYNREHVVEKYFLREVMTNFDVHNYCMLWDGYEDYCSRMDKINHDIEFTKDEFNLIKNKFEEYLDTIFYIKDKDSVDDVVSQFKKFIKYVRNGKED